MRKKNGVKKKNHAQKQSLDGLLPIESRYKELYCDTTVLGAAAKATTRLATPTIRPWQGCDTAKGGHDTTDSARAGDLAGGECRDTKLCIVTGERGLAARECVTVQSVVS